MQEGICGYASMIDILPDSLFVNYIGVTMLIAVAERRLEFIRTVLIGCSVGFASAMASVLGFYSSELYPAPLRFFVIPATSLLCSVIAARIFILKREEYPYVFYNTAVCGAMVLYRQGFKGVFEAFGSGVFAGGGFFLAMMLLYCLKFMHQQNERTGIHDTVAEVLFFTGIISLIIAGIK
jgi:hypothetical protein